MSKIYEIKRYQDNHVHRSRWHTDYNTCYINHEHRHCDDFVIKDPAIQIVK